VRVLLVASANGKIDGRKVFLPKGELATSMNLQSVRGTEKKFSRSDIQLSRLGT
jgi:hypothetical protein